MVFIWVIQHTHAPVRCFNFVLICLEFNFIASDYRKNAFNAASTWMRLYLPLFGRSKLRSNRCLQLRPLPPFWNWTADSSFQNCRPMVFSNLHADWLILAHTPPAFAKFGETRDILSESCKVLCLVVTLRGVSGNFPFYKSVFDHVGSTSSF